MFFSSGTSISRVLPFLSAAVFLWVPTGAHAQAPVGYYDSVDATDQALLRTSLHLVIKDHTRFPYTASTTDTWDILEAADQDPSNPSNVLDVYMNASYAKQGGGNANYNREHVWPKSYGFPIDGDGNYPYTDCHHLHISDSGYNSARSNRPYRSCTTGCTEYTTNVNNGEGGGSGVYPGNSNWGTGAFTDGSWETWRGRRGDIARSMFYMDIRYEGGTHGITGFSEPDLILTDDAALIASNSGGNQSVAYMGMLAVLLQWHLEDPVDDLERNRHEVVYSYQGNRNPFIDNPQWVACLFQGSCASNTTLNPPTGVSATPTTNSIDVDWFDNSFVDLVGYNIYRSATTGGPYSLLNGPTLTVSAFSDTNVITGDTFFYVITALSTTGAESQYSAEVSATVTGGGGGGGVPWINEFHYDNASTDTGEFVEVAGPAGLDLSGYTIEGYNGNGGGLYKTVTLAGSLSDMGGCVGVLDFNFTSMQNGAPDGLALVAVDGTVVEFISYEGVMTASSGAAAGMISTNVGVTETNSTPVGQSLQLSGIGQGGPDFVWNAPAANSRGLVNYGQTFDACGGAGGCISDANCDDGLICNGLETCDLATASCFAGNPVTCDDGIACTTDSCNEAAGTCDNFTSDALCDNGQFCDGAETCSATLGCQAGAPVACDDGIGCTVDTCNETGQSCNNSPNDLICDNGLFCDGAEICSTVADCQPGTAPCAGLSCDETANVCVAPPVGGSPWLNEIHYDNKSSDINEGIELAAPAGTDLSGWQLVLYNGNGGSAYAAIDLTGIMPDQQGGFGTIWVAHKGLQNGAPDGIALVNPSGVVEQFLSYEGTMTAVDGPAFGLMSTNIGVAENSRTPTGYALQLSGSGAQSADFTWNPATPHSRGAVNGGQTFAP